LPAPGSAGSRPYRSQGFITRLATNRINPVINTVKGYRDRHKFHSMFASVFGLAFGDINGDITYGPISATMRDSS
jgi:hypothetical protein